MTRTARAAMHGLSEAVTLATGLQTDTGPPGYAASRAAEPTGTLTAKQGEGPSTHQPACGEVAAFNCRPAMCLARREIPGYAYSTARANSPQAGPRGLWAVVAIVSTVALLTGWLALA